jgi:hypothetical protein
LNEGNSDLVRSDADTAFVYTRSAALSAVTGLKITDATAVFPTTEDGYAGVRAVFVPTDTTLETQYRTILYNTATVLYLDAPLVESFTGTYYIGPIELFWESRFMDLGGPEFVKVVQYIQLWQGEVSGGAVTVKYKTDVDETYQSISASTTDDFVRMAMRTRGRKVKIRVEHIATSEEIELKSFQLQFDRRGLVA